MLEVLHELAQIRNPIALAGIVEINKLKGTDEFELRIKCILDVHSRKSINELLEKRNLKMREEEDFIIIYK